jgi:hypothetical protein
VLIIQRIAEDRILAAIERGEFDDLPGQGKPLALDDYTAVPEELRTGYRLLKNAGYLPPELELRKEIQHVEELLHHVETDFEEKSLIRRLSLLRSNLAKQDKELSLFVQEGRYRKKLLQRMSGSSHK